ncbi:biotin-dependent carboxyltransferase family protein [Jeotgalibacillus haloalkalitolerans]|uniref:Biotin-dependent carboxyltransferase family protein n=1 Tax=Jeotgalibacillus haloalkalitolerans TaxID=3104292 RepID=A0ABU5KJ34_9BACL|nr:biotin-dependent carboxyltransferase family protein [Jeotgalibacillus sp. HH7-29]MDZ5710936.1 biotin-dependent carboxyltransferase family protein [Jeotgalibacillus sp. HH7-29]
MIKVVEPGLLSSIQDNGRRGHQESGIIISGVMDTFSLRIANMLVGNPEDEAGLEITLTGPTIEFLEDQLIAICGADFSATIDDQPAPLWRPVAVKKGSTLHMKFSKVGCRGVIAVGGGFDIPKVLGSKSTYLRANIGGFKGRSLEKEDIIQSGERSSQSERIFKSVINHPVKWSVSNAYTHNVYDRSVMRVIPGKQYHDFTEESRNCFFEQDYKISKQSDRMGFRLDGDNLECGLNGDMLSEGVAFGTIQVPADGQPIILLADRQTLGGYPKIGQIASVDLPALIQKKPGEAIRFEEISIQDAQNLFKQREKEWQELKQMINIKLEGLDG